MILEPKNLKIYNLKKSKINEQIKSNKIKHANTENTVVITLGVVSAQERAKWVKEINCIVMNGNEISSGKHTIRAYGSRSTMLCT